MRNSLKIILILLLVSALGFAIILVRDDSLESAFVKLASEEKRQLIIKFRDAAILQAKEDGDYRCCVEPPCTMCYMEGNKWNNFQAGTCACDDLIARGEEPCPQCKNGITNIHDENNIYCDINAAISSCH